MRPPQTKDLVDFLRSHRELWWSLHRAHHIILKHELIGHCLLAFSKPSFLYRIAPWKLLDFPDFQKLFHDSIRLVLEKNGVCFQDELLDQALATYFHQRLIGRKVRLHHNRAASLKQVKVFNKLLRRYPRSALILYLKNMKKEDIPRVQ